MIPIFNAHLMSRRGLRKFRTKTVRGMMSWAHGKFRETLKSMCDKKGKVMINISESYTSKTCSSCDWIDEKLSGKKYSDAVRKERLLTEMSTALVESFYELCLVVPFN